MEVRVREDETLVNLEIFDDEVISESRASM